ncbi:MAG TPA: hypothetical protein VNZ57_00475 [Longimicrobiales bacterium]|nr:hypothetical protein [Longimicrobiales bacterium]
MGYYYSLVPFRSRIPTVVVRLATDEGEITFRARWSRAAVELQRRILYRLRHGKPLWFEDEWGHAVCFKPESVWGAVVDGRPGI